MSTPAAQTVETYLNATFSAGSLMEATTALVAPIRKAFQEDGVSADELDFGQIWAPLIAAARKAAYNEEPTPEHTAIVALLASLKASGVLIRDKDNSVCQSWGGTAWTGLPGFGASMREAWNDAPPALSAQEWESLNAFAARCATAGVADFSLYCIWTLREALESPHATTLKDSKQPASSETRPATLEELVPAVAAWLDIYGADMVKHVQTGTDFAHGGNAGNPGMFHASRGRGSCKWR